MYEKLPIKLVWQLFGKIFEDLDLSKFQRSLFQELKVAPSNCYELIYGLLLVLLDSTKPLHKSLQPGIANDLYGFDLNKTILQNTLRDCQVYSKTCSYVWLCVEQ